MSPSSEQDRLAEALEALRASEKLLRTVIAGAPIVLFSTDVDGIITLSEGLGLSSLGLKPGENVGRSAFDLYKDVPWIVRSFQRALKGESFTERGEVQGVVFETHFEPLRGDDGSVAGIIGVATDVTTRARMERALKASEERYRDLFEGAHDLIYVHDLTGKFISMNKMAERVTGFDRKELGDVNIIDVLTPETAATARAMLTRKLKEGGTTTYEIEIKGKDGKVIPLELSTRLMFENGRAVAVQGIARDISERRAQTRALEHQALHDPLTGLPNRTLLRDRLGQAIAMAGREKTAFAVMLIDLDHFKEINNTLGHEKGDLVLKEINPRLRSILRASDTVARWGGDEFGLILTTTDRHGAEAAATKILETLEDPFRVGELQLRVDASIGIALFPDHGEDADTLLKRVDVAMLRAQQNRNGFAFYEAEYDQHSPRRLELAAELRTAIENSDLALHFQPVYSAKDRGVIELEALVRWPHPTEGLLAPDRFIHLAERSGLIKPLTQWVLTEAIKSCKAWKDQGFEVGVAANLSARNLGEADLPDRISRLLMEHDLPTSCLTLEITESTIMGEWWAEVIEDLHQMGVKLSIDDFGTGFSSLTHLKRLPVQQIKIDRCFITDYATDEGDAAIAGAIVDLGRNLGLEVVAEGIEDEEVLGRLVSRGCDLLQGYHLSRPVPVDDVPKVISAAG